MSFWDEYQDTGGSFITAAEKDVIMENGIPLTITSAFEENHPKYGQRYVTNVLAPNPETGDEEERAISFPIGTVESRDRMIAQLIDYLKRDESEPVKVKLEKKGRSILIRQA